MQYETESGTVIGNVENKYDTRNPISQILMDGFFSAFDNLVQSTGVREVHEIGCGEGHLSSRLLSMGLTVRSSDFSTEIINKASTLYVDSGIDFQVRSIYEINRNEDGAPLVVCCEVLEHLEHPDRGLEKLAEIVDNFCLLSVPREPLWRALNFGRGKYLKDFGNTPGHLQHWSRNGFLSFVSRQFNIVEFRSPLPWTMVLCRAKS